MSDQLLNSHPYRQTIAPIAPGTKRPLWSVMIPTYNCAEYLPQTLESVLRQDLGAELMQIMVVDDCSSQEDLQTIVKEIGQGRVQFYQQPENVGAVRNFQTCLDLAQGELIHLLHGDDCVRDGFYTQLQYLFEQYPEMGAAFCQHLFMTEQGKWFTISKLEQSENGLLPRTWLSRLANTCCIQTPSIAVRRSVYEHLGGFDQRLYTTEDWEMWVRIACHYPIGYVAEPLAIYRQHSASFSRRNIRDGTHFRNLRQTIALFQSYLPADVVATSRGQVWRDYACYALSYADTFIRHSDFTAAIVLIRQALFMSRSLVVLKWIIRMLLVDIPYHWLKTWFKTRLKTLRSEEICP